MIKPISALIAIDTVIANTYEMWGLDVWDGYALSLLFRAAIWSGLIVYLIPYKYIQAKTLAFVFFLTQAWDVVQYYTDDVSAIIMAAVSTGVFASWLGFTLLRHYNQDDDVLTDRYVYTIATRPDGPQGFLVSLFGDEFGVYAHYIRGTVYYYHHGEYLSMPMEDFPMAGKTIIKTNVEVNAKVIGKAESMLSSKWTWWFNNCLTVLMRLRHV